MDWSVAARPKSVRMLTSKAAGNVFHALFCTLTGSSGRAASGPPQEDEIIEKDAPLDPCDGVPKEEYSSSALYFV